MTRIADRSSVRRVLAAMLPTTLAAAFLTVPGYCAEAPLDVLTKAIQREGAVKAKAVRLIYTHGAASDQYMLEEVLPDRLHMIRTNAGHKLEVIAVSPITYIRWDGGSWTSSPMARAGVDMSAVTGLLLRGMSVVKELPVTVKAGKKQRNFSGNISWTNHGSEHRGTLAISIGSVSRLPVSLAFTGTCNGAACSFRQTFSYDPGIKIDAPVP